MSELCSLYLFDVDHHETLDFRVLFFIEPTVGQGIRFGRHVGRGMFVAFLDLLMILSKLTICAVRSCDVIAVGVDEGHH